jgi:tRNA-dihydrouridine synthase
VTTPEDVLAMFAETGCDAVMAGRATMKNPWIFRQAAELLAGRPYREATLRERKGVILDHFRLIQRDDADAPRALLSKLRTFTGWYTHGLPNGGELRRRIASLESPQAFLDAVEEFFAAHTARVAA